MSVFLCFVILLCVCVFCVHVFCVSLLLSLHSPHTPVPPWCDNYLVVMDKVYVLAVEVVRPGHRSRGDRSKDRVLRLSLSSHHPPFILNSKQLKVTSNKATTFKLIWTAQSLFLTFIKEHVQLRYSYIVKYV